MFDIISEFDIHLVYLFVFSFGLAFGVGASLLSGVLSLTAISDGVISTSEGKLMNSAKVVGWFSFLVYSFSGIGLFTLSYEAMIGLGIFWAAQTIVIILLFTMGFLWLFLRRHLSEATSQDDKILFNTTPTRTSIIVVGELIVFVSWVFLLIHHVLYRVPFTYWQFLALYVLALLFGVGVYTCFVRTKHGKTLIQILRKIITVLGVVFLGIIAMELFIGGIPPEDKEQTASTVPNIEETVPKNKFPFLSVEMVSTHNNNEDCWVIIDHKVFDATDAVALFPEVYTCGVDVTENYRTVVPEGISDRMQKKQVGIIGYDMATVSGHGDKKNCWIIIDDIVFDATKESILHPAAFHCGKDVSTNYHKNHGDEISSKMMQYQIGFFDDGRGVAESDTANEVEDKALTPYRELYVEEGSWDPHNLMVIVEKTPEKLLFIDGSTHTEVGRIHDVGFQPHTSVYSRDAEWMFIIARDGWLTKINLKTLIPIKTVKVGINSRGTALTENGKYLAIGNYEPANIVILDSDTLEILKEIPTTGELRGKYIESRVGALTESGETIIAALKDLNSVWVIDTNEPDFPVIQKHPNIGNNETPLHDAYLTPDGKFYIVASMGSNSVWVLNTETWEPVGEIPTGMTPHTGPGATWGNYTYVPAMGEGLITAIDITTWKAVAHIKTGGPGLFVRSFLEDPEYPYVWAETAFGDHQDEIYVIDARTNTIAKTLIPLPGESSWHPEFTNDGKFVYVVSQSGNEIEVYDANTFDIVKRITSETPSAVSNVGNRIDEKGL
jgi:protein NirF